MEKAGYIKLHRKLVDWEWYDSYPEFKLFTHLLLTVNHTENYWRGEKIERGCRVTSLASLSMETGLSIQQIRTAIKHLKSTGELTSVSRAKNTLFIVLNYNLYQGDNTITNKQLTNNQQTTNKQLTTNNNEKNIKNDKNIKENITKETYVSLISDYTSNESLISALNDFVEMRKKMKGFTTRAMQLALKSLDKIAIDDDTKTAIVNQSIENSWKSFYPLKKKSIKHDENNLPEWFNDNDVVKVDTNDFNEADLMKDLKDLKGMNSA